MGLNSFRENPPVLSLLTILLLIISFTNVDSHTLTSKICPCEQQIEARFCLYAQQIWGGSDPTDVYTYDPHRPGDFGAIRSDDWPLLDGPGANAKLVGRVQGHHIKSNTNTFVTLFQVLLQDDRYFNGSSLSLHGPGGPDWAIVGGTGQLTLAQGIVTNTVASSDADGVVRRMCFHFFYRSIVASNVE